MSAELKSKAPCFPLSLSKPGQLVHVAGVLGREEDRGRLLALGIVPGSEITLMQKSDEGLSVIRVGQSRLAIDKSIAAKVMVSEPNC